MLGIRISTIAACHESMTQTTDTDKVKYLSMGHILHMYVFEGPCLYIGLDVVPFRSVILPKSLDRNESRAPQRA